MTAKTVGRVLIPLPQCDYDPTETAAPWAVLSRAGHTMCFATPSGAPGRADERVLTGKGLAFMRPLLSAKHDGRNLYREMEKQDAFAKPMPYSAIRAEEFDGLVLPGGHAPGMREYLESDILRAAVLEFFQKGKPVGAICHGVLIPARTKIDGRSVLHGRKTTALLRSMELPAWIATFPWLGNYIRTYPESVQSEVTRALANPGDFVSGPFGLSRDSMEKPARGFAVVDGRYVSSRWPGDAFRFAHEFKRVLEEYLATQPGEGR